MTLETIHPQLEYKRLDRQGLEGILVKDLFGESSWRMWVPFSTQMKKLARQNQVLFDPVQEGHLLGAGGGEGKQTVLIREARGPPLD